MTINNIFNLHQLKSYVTIKPAYSGVAQKSSTNPIMFPNLFDLTTLNGYSVSTAGDFNGDGKADLVLGAADASPFGRTYAGWCYSVSTAGDINGDGKADLVLGSRASPVGGTNVGTVYVLLGQASGWPSQFNLTTLNGTNGFAIPGLGESDYLGYSVSTAGDINGDGKADLVLGAFGASPGGHSDAGMVYVLLGQASGWPSQFNLMTLNGTNGFAIPGLNTNDLLGSSVSTAGDINGDGKADLVLGAYGASPGGHTSAGTVYVLLGQASGWPSQFNLTTLNGTDGFVIPGLNVNDNLGHSVSTAGDINGDGKADLVLGAYGASPGLRTYAGMVYVIFGVNTTTLISQNLTACPLNQSLQWGYHDIVIASAQALHLSPVDISVACGNSSQPYLGAYFRITHLQSATLQHRNASGGCNMGQSTFFGQDLAMGQVVLLQDGSTIAPQLTIIATDGVTTLPDQAIQVQFTLIDSSPILLSFHLSVLVAGRATLTSDNIILRSSGKLADLVLSVTGVQNGYFVQIDAPDVPIMEFTNYQVQTGQIQIVHTGGNEPIQFNMRVSDGLTSSAEQPETVTLLGIPKDPVTQVGVSYPVGWGSSSLCVLSSNLVVSPKEDE